MFIIFFPRDGGVMQRECSNSNTSMNEQNQLHEEDSYIMNNEQEILTFAFLVRTIVI